MNSEKTLLVIEDEPAIVGFLRSSLAEDGWRIIQAPNVQTGLQEAAAQKPNVILLDLGLPHGDALGCLKALRQWNSIPVILMVSQGQEEAQAAGLAAGADDYLVKPFDRAELIARLSLALRHAEERLEDAPPVYDHEGLRMDLIARRVWFLNKEIHLSPLQYEFLAVLARRAGRVVGYRELIDRVWGEGRKVSQDCMRVSVYQMRKKVEANPGKPRSLKTEPGVGYRLESPGRSAGKSSGARPFFTNSFLMAQQ